MQELGPYRIEGELARGGMGVVLRALDRRHRRPVALKVLAGALGETTSRRRFVREVQALAALDHPHIVRVYDAGEQGGVLYLAMELVEGESLAARVQRLGPHSSQQVAQLGLQMARALAYAHAAGLIHRDVKPGNVLVTADGQAKLADFGLVRDLDPERSRLSRTGVFLGTPGYWPPEQALGLVDRIGPASDVYALGATLYAALTGRPPFECEDIPGFVHAAEHLTPEPPHRVEPGVDRALERIVLRCLEKEPTRRYPTAGALADDLEAWLAGEREAPPEPGRRKALVLAAGTLLAGAALALALVVARRGPPPPVVSGPPAPEAPPAADPTAELEQAAALLRAGKPAEAEAACAGLIARDPRDARARRLRGLALVAGERRAEALAELESALAAGQDDPELRAGLSLARLAARDTRGALSEAERAVARDPGLALAHQALGEALLGLGELPRAEEALTRAHEAGGGGLALAARSEVRRQRGDAAGALADLGAAVAADPDRPDWLTQRGILQLQAGHADLALADAVRSLTLAPNVVRGRILEAKALLALRRHAEALASADRAVALDPGQPGAHSVRAVALAGLGRGGEAERELDRAVELEPASVEALFGRARLRELRGARSLALQDLDSVLTVSPDDHVALADRARLRLESGDPRGAAADADRALKLTPTPTVKFLLVALNAHAALGDTPRARELADRVLELEPDHAGVLMLRATLLARLGDPTRAEADLDRAVQLAPDEPDIRLDRATLRRLRGDMRGALEDASSVLERAPTHARALVERGLARLALHQEGAEADARAAAASDPEESGVAHLEGALAASRGDWSGAIAAYDRSLERVPRQPEVLYARARARWQLHDLDGARADLERLLAFAPDHPGGRYLRGRMTLDSDGDPRQALEDLERACAGAPEQGLPLLYRGVARERLEEEQGALVDYGRAVELDPELLDAWLQRANLRLRLDDPAGCEADAGKALELAPGAPDGWVLRAAARLLQGKRAEAEADATRALELAAPESSSADLARTLLERARAPR